MCDECRIFQMKTVGLCGSRPRKSQTDKCKKPQKIPNGTTKHTPYMLIEKKMKAIDILQDYDYKVIDDSCEKKLNLD